MAHDSINEQSRTMHTCLLIVLTYIITRTVEYTNQHFTRHLWAALPLLMPNFVGAGLTAEKS